jgi:hypothetical protein
VDIFRNVGNAIFNNITRSLNMWKVELLNRAVISELECSWEKLPKIPITKLYYELPNKKTLLLQGFESYLYLKEIYQLIIGLPKQKIDSTINLFGKYNNEVCQISYNIIKGQLLQRKNIWGKEFTPLIWNTTKKTWDVGKARSTNHNFWNVGWKEKKAEMEVLN